MSAATAAVNTPERAGSKISLPVAAATTLYAGTLIARDSSGNAVSAADTSGLRVVGRAEETVDNSAGSAGDLSIAVKRGTFRFANSSGDAVDANDEGKLCYVEDNQTVNEAGGTNLIVAGRVIDVDADGVWVAVGDAPVKAGYALTSSQNSTTAASDLTTAQALANALKTSYNALQADVVALRALILG